jgi:hypothetical protein
MGQLDSGVVARARAREARGWSGVRRPVGGGVVVDRGRRHRFGVLDDIPRSRGPSGLWGRRVLNLAGSHRCRGACDGLLLGIRTTAHQEIELNRPGFSGASVT